MDDNLFLDEKQIGFLCINPFIGPSIILTIPMLKFLISFVDSLKGSLINSHFNTCTHIMLINMQSMLPVV
jgi:hypothetical protein